MHEKAFTLGCGNRYARKFAKAFRWIFLPVHFPCCDQWICLGNSGRVPKESKCAGYESRAYYQPERIP
ncbi:MAG TPA: hypothetical protein VGJ76_10350, partial [Pseudolabrys sp.]